MSIFHLIDNIRKRPGMYLGSNSITALWHFLNGYQAAERELAPGGNRELFPLSFRYMHEYTGYRLKDHSNLGWSEQLLRSCDGDEEAALWKFFEFYDGFTRVRMRKYWKAVLSDDNIAWNNQMEHSYRMRPKVSETGFYTVKEMSFVKEPIYCDPLTVYVIELTIPAYILVVETASSIRPDPFFFSSSELAKGNHLFPEGAEIYFGPIGSWEEFTAGTISFEKSIIV